MNISEIFPNWKDTEPGSWAKPVKENTIEYRDIFGSKRLLEIGVYREPISEEENSGSYTLHIFDGDDVILCTTIKEL